MFANASMKISGASGSGLPGQGRRGGTVKGASSQRIDRYVSEGLRSMKNTQTGWNKQVSGAAMLLVVGM